MTYLKVGRGLCVVATVAAIFSVLPARNVFATSSGVMQNSITLGRGLESSAIENPSFTKEGATKSALGAEVAPSKQTLVSLEQALARTLDKNPELKMFSYRLRVADADILQAGLRPMPEVSLEVENIGGNAPYNGVDSAQVTLALSQLIELGGKRDRREDVAAAGGYSERLAYEVARLDVLGETLRRYVELAQAQASVELALRAVALAEDAEQAARFRVKAGAAPLSDVTRLMLSRQQVGLALRRAQVRQKSAGGRLALMWGEGGHDSGAENLNASSALLPLPSLPSRKILFAQLDQAPLLRMLTSQTRLHEAQVRLAESSGRADMRVSIGARRDFQNQGNSMVFGLSMPIGLAKSSRANTARAQAELRLSQVGREAGEIAVLASLDEMYRALEFTHESLALLEQESLPLMRQLYTDIEKGYRAGRYSLLELINAQQERLSLEQGVIDLAATFHLQRNELERLTGQTFSSASEINGEQE
jgi:outer membrane protein, heavy metal efflux system